MRDARFRPDEPGFASQKKDLAEWRVRVESFLASQLAVDGDRSSAAAGRQRWNRIATFDLVCGIDWQLQASVGIKGLAHFQVDEMRPLAPMHLRPRLTIVWDKGARQYVCHRVLVEHEAPQDDCNLFTRTRVPASHVEWREACGEIFATSRGVRHRKP